MPNRGGPRYGGQGGRGGCQRFWEQDYPEGRFWEQDVLCPDSLGQVFDAPVYECDAGIGAMARDFQAALEF